MSSQEEVIRGMKVVELKAELAKHNLPQTGKKDELIERLLEHLATSSSSAKGVKSPVAPVSSVAPSVPVVDSAVAPVQAGQKKATAAPAVVSTVSAEEAARLARAARFGIQQPVPNPASTNKKSAIPIDSSLLSDEARQRRIERFGLVEPATKKSKTSATSTASVTSGVPKVKIGGGAVGLDVEALKARQERFGVVTSKILARTEAEEAKQRRMERFGGAN